MIIASLLTAGVLSLRAAAFLVVPETDVAAAPFPKTVHHHDNNRLENVSLKCTECPFPERDADGNVNWTDGFDTALVRESRRSPERIGSNGRMLTCI
jgi:hypothetical protein